MSMRNARPDAMPDHSSRPPYYVQALAMGLPAISFGLTIQPWLDLPHLVGRGGDLRHLYTAAYMVRTGHGEHLYDLAAQKVFQDSLVSQLPLALPFNHLAYESLLFVPLTFVPYRIAFALYMAFNLALLVICYRLLGPELAILRKYWRWLPVALFFGFVPLSVALMQGQDSILLLALLVAAFVALRRNRPFLAGMLLGLGTFKFQIVLPIAALFVVWRRLRFSLGLALSAAVCAVLSLLIVRMNGLADYLRMLRGMSYGLNAPNQVLYAIPPGFMANVRGLVYGTLGNHLSAGWLHVLSVFLSATILALVAFFPVSHSKDCLLIAATASSLVSYHMLSHDMSILLLPLAVALGLFSREERMLAIAALAFFAPALDMIYRPAMFLVSIPILVFLWLLISFLRRLTDDFPHSLQHSGLGWSEENQHGS